MSKEITYISFGMAYTYLGFLTYVLENINNYNTSTLARARTHTHTHTHTLYIYKSYLQNETHITEDASA